MSVLALKALGYGAEQIPDSFFEKIPGGFFTPKEKKDRKDRRKKEQRSESRRSRRDRSPSTNHSDYSAYDDTDEKTEQRKTEQNRREKSMGRSSSRSLSRGRYNQRSTDLDGESSDHIDMARVEEGQGQGPYFPPPPPSGYASYNPQEYPQRPARDDYNRSSSVQPGYSHSPQPVTTQAYPSQTHGASSPTVAYGAESARRYEEIQHANFTQAQQPRSSSIARYTPGPGYSPSPQVMPGSSIPPPPIGSNSTHSTYNPADYASSNTNYQVSGNPYASPPPFYRQRSNSQPSFTPGLNLSYQTYTPSAPSQQISQYDQPPSRRDSSTKHRHEHRRRARSADSHSRTHSSRKSHHQEDSSIADYRERLDGKDLRKKSLAATVGGALAGGFAGRALGGRSKLTTIVGAAAGALGGRAYMDKREGSQGDHHSPSHSRSRSRSRSRNRDHEKGQHRGLRARSRSTIDRFRGKSRDGQDQDKHHERNGRRSHHGHRYVQDEEYDYFTESDNEGNGNPVRTRKKASRRDH